MRKIASAILALMVLLVLLAPFAFALSSLPANAFSENSLSGEINAEGSTATLVPPNTIGVKATQSPEVVRVVANLSNPSDTLYALYLMKASGGNWELVQPLGSLAGKTSVQVNLDIKLEYPSQSKKSTQYALVAYDDGSGKVKGKTFVIDENWEKYEENFKVALAQTNLYIVPVLTILLIIIIFVLAESAYRRRLCDGAGCEYNTRTLFFPRMRGRARWEQASDLIINPFFWLFELLAVLALVSIIYNMDMASFGLKTGTEVFLIAGVGALVLPIIYFALAWWAEYYNQKPIRFFIALFMWGAFSAFLAFTFNSYVPLPTIIAGLIGTPEAKGSLAIIGTVLIAPVIEEVAKGIGIFIIAGNDEMNDTLTGLLFGFSVGVGFAFVENWFYFASKANPIELGLASWFGLIVYRSFFNTLAHGSFTAATAAVIGYMKCHKAVAKYAMLGIIPGLFLAISLHAMFNISALLDGFAISSYKFTMFIFNPMLVGLLALMFVIVFSLAQKESRKLAAKRAGSTA